MPCPGVKSRNVDRTSFCDKMKPMKQAVENLVSALDLRTREAYGDRLVSSVIFGSVAAGVSGPDSDVDHLLVVRELPRGRIPRVEEHVRLVEVPFASALRLARQSGWNARLSPIFKTPEEARAGSPLFWDMTDRARVLFDRDGFFADLIESVRKRLAILGAHRVYKGGGYYWILKEKFVPGEVIEL